MPSAVAPAVPRVKSARFGEFALTRKLGEGGMAEVFAAEAVDLRGEITPLAVKFMKPQVEGLGADASELFATEADVMSLLRHPNLVQLYEVGKYGERMYLAMEFVAGGDLQALLTALKEAERPVPPSVALTLGIDLLKGLAYLHQAQTVRGTPLDLVHGDINPSNVFVSVESGEAKLADFGVVSSAALGGLPGGMTAGKLHYLSPEQAGGRPLTPASDLFAMGVVMFELLVGARPFEGTSEQQILERIAAGKYFRPGDLSDALEKVFERALAKSPKNRYPTAGAFAADLLRYQLDNDLQCSRQHIREFVQEALGIVA